MDMGRPADFGDEKLVERAQKGEREAFEILVERYKRKVYRIAYHFTRDREEARDISQEAFFRAFKHLRSFDLRSTFYTWFYRILVNLCIDRRRRRRLFWASSNEHAGEGRNGIEVMETADLSSEPDQQAAARETSRLVAAALDSLPVKQRTVFVLRNHQGLSIREIAAIMRTAEGTVKVHLHRAVAALRERLGQLA
jgi:RNA polymerase sigma-70 factor (ECF subfamily)